MDKGKRLIDANRLWRYAWNELQKANKRHEGEPDFKAWSSGVAEVIVALAKDMPTVDAVEVVRCRDCKHWQHMGDGMGDCTNARFHLDGHADPTMEADGFCSCGERKDND